MSESFIAILVLIALMIGLPVLILLIRDRLTRPSRKQIEEASARFTERLKKPDLAALEAHYGHALPASLVALYRDSREIMRGDFWVAETSDAPEEKRWYVAFYVPADAQSTKDTWPGTEKYFTFADDGCGNGYLIDPRLADPPVFFHDHETGDLSPVADRLSAVMKWPRIPSSS